MTETASRDTALVHSALPAPLKGTRYLSEILQGVHVEYRARYLAAYREALGDGVVRAVPLSSTFEYESPRSKGKATLRSINQELVWDDEAFRVWHAATVRAVMMQVAAGKRKLEVTLEDLQSGAVDFDEAARVHAARFKRSAGKKASEKKKR